MVAVPVDAPPRPVDLDTTPRREWVVVLVAALAVAGCGFLLTFVTPEHVDEVTIENPTENDLTLVAHAPDEDSVTFIGNVERGDTRTLHQVLDQGETWVIEMRYAGQVVAEETVTRDELRDGWSIPTEVGEQIADAGFTPSAP